MQVHHGFLAHRAMRADANSRIEECRSKILLVDLKKRRGRRLVKMPRRSNPAAFKPGWKGGPGRPPGKRNYLTEVALGALGDDFAEHGKAAIEKVRREKTHVYLQIVASLLPRQVQVERTSVLGELSDEEIAMVEEYLAASRARLVKKIERQNGAANFPPASPNPDTSK
jgi:hypothetical protein